MSLRRILFILLNLAYPPLVYLGYRSVATSRLALLLAALALLRALSSREKIWRITAGLAMVLALVSLLADQFLPLKLYPALVSAAFLTLFGASLLYPPSMVERIARLQEGELPPQAVRYTRRVTQVWCGFFVLNGSLALFTALWSDNALWALYNGLIAYLMMAALFGAEWLVRQQWKRRNAC
jgi:uncharacterized membrane protein